MREHVKSWKRFDWLASLGLLVCALLPRLYELGRAGLCHFDEGGYALGALALARGTAPAEFITQQHFLSPPGYFGLAGMLMRVFGESEYVLIGISVALGSLTAPLLFAITREWATRGAAVAAGLLAALSNYHVLYSRMALTDVSFTFLFLLALLLFLRGSRSERMSTYLTAGIVTGLAWNTKYHGWLIGVVALLAHRKRLRELPVALRMLAAAGVAVACYLPWVEFVQQQPGGYAALTAEQGRFLADWTSYFKHAWNQLDSQWFLDGWMARLALPVALLLAAWIDRRAEFARVARLAPAVLLFSWALGSTLALALFVLPVILRRARTDPHVLWMLFVFALLTPLYHPYPRLLMPLLACLWMFAGRVFEEPWTRWERAPLVANVLALVSLLVIGSDASGERYSPAGTWYASDGLREVATHIAELSGPDERVVVFAEPGVVFHLRLAGRRAEHVNSKEELERALAESEPFKLVTGHYYRALGLEGGDARALGEFPVQVNDARLLNDAGPWKARSWRRSGGNRHRLRVYDSREL